MTGDYGYRYFVGWCPDCDSVTVEKVCDGQEVPSCGCGKRLRDVTACKDMREVGAVIDRIMEGSGKPKAHEGTEKRRKAEEQPSPHGGAESSHAAAPHGDPGLEELFGMVFSYLGCDGDCGSCADGAPEEDELGRGELYGFALVPSPFMVYVRGEGYEDAVATLRDNLDDFAMAGFGAALEEGELGFHVIPVDGQVTYRAEKATE